MEQKEFMQMCLDVYRYCTLYREQTADEIGDFIYFFVTEQLVKQRIAESKGGADDWTVVQEALQAEQKGWLRYHYEEAARGKEAMKFLRELIAVYEHYSHAL